MSRAGQRHDQRLERAPAVEGAPVLALLLAYSEPAGVGRSLALAGLAYGTTGAGKSQYPSPI
ncbi:hypothetical protein ACVWZK_008436 [Bradyrhizobium sp. GM0.4]